MKPPDDADRALAGTLPMDPSGDTVLVDPSADWELLADGGWRLRPIGVPWTGIAPNGIVCYPYRERGAK